MASTGVFIADTKREPQQDYPTANGTESQSQREVVKQQRTPLPVKQVFVLCLMRFAEPISFSVIFPFINQMIEESGVTSDPKQLGYYSGLVESLFALAQFCTVFFWGSLSDRIGRRPVLILGLCGVAGSTIMFGLSKSFPMILVSRALNGALNGNVAVIKSVLGEITDDTNRALAFSYLPFCWSLGSVLAPIIGGFLSHPAERYPSVFGYEVFRRFPYFLPCLAGSALSIVGLVAGALFLEESLSKDKGPAPNSVELQPLFTSNSPDHPQSPSPPNNNSAPNLQQPSPYACNSTPDTVEKRVPSIKEIIRVQSVRRVLISYGFMAFVTVSIAAVYILWLYTPINSGGIGLSTAEIGTTLSVSGILGVAFTTIIYPPLDRRVGTVVVYRFGMIMQVLNLLAFPLGRAIALAGGKKGAYAGAAIVLIMRMIASIVVVCNMLLVNNAAPSKRSLGTVNGLAQMVASASRAVGPIATTSLFAISVEKNVIGGNMIWLVLSVVALLGAFTAFQMPRKPSENESQGDN